MGLSGQVVDFVYGDAAQDLHERRQVGHVAVVKRDAATQRVAQELSSLRRGPDEAMHLVAFLQQDVDEIGAILARDACGRWWLVRICVDLCDWEDILPVMKADLGLGLSVVAMSAMGEPCDVWANSL